MLTRQMLEELPKTPAGERAAWVLHRLAAVAGGAAGPDGVELARQYTRAWLSEVPMSATFAELAPAMAAVTGVRQEPARPNEFSAVLELPDGLALRFRCTVQENAPHRIDFQLCSPAMAPSTYVDRMVHRDGRAVAVRDFGGDGPLLLLWHGAGCDASIWEAMVPHLRSFRVVAQDLPGHGGSPLPRLSVGDTLADTRALLGDLRSDRPIVVGHSMGGWAALHFAAAHPCRALVCLDGPTTLDYAAMGIAADHPGYLPDPPDVPADLGSLRCPAMIMLCRGESEIEEEWMVPFRAGLSDHLATNHPDIRVVWQDTGHMVVLSQPQPTADLIVQFIGDLAD